MSIKKLSLSDYSQLTEKMSEDFDHYLHSDDTVPEKIIYKINNSNSNTSKKQALLGFIKGFKKVAFDTRRVDQESERIPRTNLQNWARSQSYTDDETFKKSEILSKLVKPVDFIKDKFGKDPDYHNSYSRILQESVHRILNLKEGSKEVFSPQVNYLEQLMYNRYRLTMEDINKLGELELVNVILSKDDSLIKKSSYLSEKIEKTGDIDKNLNSKVIGENSKLTQESIVNAIFGNNDFRKDGEKSTTRTITITIKDSVDD